MKRALIIGGTRGMGRALAEHYLAQGMAVTVCGRHPDVLAGSSLARHPNLTVVALDIGDAAAVARVVAQAAAPTLDLLVVTAGLYFNTRTHPLDEATTLQMLATNVTGLANALEAGARCMLAQGHGQMAAIASVAGVLKDYPGASTYSATKRSVLSLCDTYRKALAPFGVAVTAIAPGYVDTERLRELNGGNARHKPFLVSEAQAVQRISQAIAERQAVCQFPWPMHALVRLINLLPRVPRLPSFEPPTH
ncbi:MAG: SDR family NAD(P)-dependent oxidoreductase [Burkholderiales bacterium]